MTKIIIDGTLKLLGIQEANHVFLYGVSMVDDKTRSKYLETAYQLGKEY